MSTASRSGGHGGGNGGGAWSEAGGSEYGMATFQLRKRAAPDPHKFDPLLIEDPLMSSNNIGRNCFRFAYIKRECANAHSSLLAALQQLASSVDEDDNTSPILLLGSIIKDSSLIFAERRTEMSGSSLTLSHVRFMQQSPLRHHGGEYGSVTRSMGGCSTGGDSTSESSCDLGSPLRRNK